ncbi:threonine/serine ThrE exporter family protein [Allonocardiopsis opalescens]|uniref:Uncharacterized membrane protein YjjP (DUF1212 family) n=1 Tax=Allonocardiopsis opalescens TaxID=1144618 RepID=A0A2T0Q449_9ACTN|nr:threonine/serine exporter family protein [Allonocardiopsis opalescens]PRX98577.1 uncharacterized membrane protein YjjP (DUF1212 family) [Allonocardiopsis opalescens]
MSQQLRRPAPAAARTLWHRLQEWNLIRLSAPHDGGPDLTEDEQLELLDNRAVDLILRVGELLLASGESTESVTEAMLSLSVAYGLPRSEASVTFTAITLSCHPRGQATPITGERVVRRRSPDYTRLTQLHAFVQEAALGLVDLDEAFTRLRQIKSGRPDYPRWMAAVGLGGIAASASVMVGGGALVAAVAFLATIVGDRVGALLGRRGIAEFYQLVAAAAISSLFSVLLLISGLEVYSAAVVVGGVIALLPGRPLVASVQDGIAGSYVSAAARLLEVFFVVTAIVAGLCVTMYAAIRLGVPVDVDQLPRVHPGLAVVPLLASMAMALSFGLNLMAPRRTLLFTTLGGGLIWTGYVVLRLLDLPPVAATAFAAVLLGVVSHLVARWTRTPPLVYLAPAIAPLLPGSMLYQGVIDLNLGAPSAGLLGLAQAVFVALALGAGVNFGGELIRAFYRGGWIGTGFARRPAARRTRGY